MRTSYLLLILRNRLRIFAFALLFLVMSCATSTQIDNTHHDSSTNPSLEPVNHYFYDFNQFFDTLVFQPIARTYDVLIPSFVQQLIDNFINNFHTPVDILNYLFQGETEKAQRSFGRFIFNSSFGFFGIADMASEAGLAYEPTDFGITMAKWGYTESSYFVIPFAGPSTIRDTIGMGVDALLNPFNIAAFNPHNKTFSNFDWGRFGVEVVNSRAKVLPLTDEFDKALDPYTSMKSMYLQNRAYELGIHTNSQNYDYDFDFEDDY